MKGLIKLVGVAGVAFAAYWFGFRGGCGTRGALACPDPALEQGVGETLSAAEVCPRAGYLCSESRAFQVARWGLDKGKLRVRVNLPEFATGDEALRIRAAAIEGIMAWDRRPFPIVIDTDRFTVRMWDVRVVWTQGLYNEAGGLLHRQVSTDGKRLAHALGLGHSDSEGDIMFPRLAANATQLRVSARDFLTVDALYELPNGAMLR